MGVGPAILSGGIRAGLMEKLTFQRSLEGSEGLGTQLSKGRTIRRRDNRAGAKAPRQGGEAAGRPERREQSELGAVGKGKRIG